GGGGQDVLDGGPGDNVVLQGGAPAPVTPPDPGPVNQPPAPHPVPPPSPGPVSTPDPNPVAAPPSPHPLPPGPVFGAGGVSDTTHAGSAALLGQFMASSFVGAGTGFGSGTVADPQPNQQPFLVQPHG